MNTPDLIKLENFIVRHQVDTSDAIGLVDAILKALEYHYGWISEDLEAARGDFIVALAKFDDEQEKKPDEMDLARDYLVSLDEKVLT